MKVWLAVVALWFSLSPVVAQSQLTPDQWQADLKFLQETVHKDYSFLFKKVTAEAFDAEIDKLAQAIPQLEDHEIVAGISRIIALFQYGHTRIGHGSENAHFHAAPLYLYAFADGLYVQAAHQKYKDAVGAKVIKVGGQSVEDALAAIRPLVPAENDQYFKAFGMNLLRIPEALHAQRVIPELDKSITYTLERDGKTMELTVNATPGARETRYGFMPQSGEWVEARDQAHTPLYLKNLDRIYYFEYLPEQKTVYIRHSEIQDDPQESIPDFYQRVFEFIEANDVDRMVLDVRLNTGGNNYKNKPIVTGILGCQKINQPGKLFVIIGRRTFSACQNLVNELDNYTNAIFVGEPTSENINFYGDNRRVDLPNSKIPVFLSFAWWQDKPQWENKPWLAPDIAVDMTFDDYRNNRDPVLEAVFSVPTTGAITDPVGRLRELFETQKLDEVRSEARAMIEDPRYKFLDFERELNDAGYRLLGERQMQEARVAFQLNTELFPESANVWDSFAEWHWKSNDLDNATKYYQKAIALDPDGPTGQNARTMLEQMKRSP